MSHTFHHILGTLRLSTSHIQMPRLNFTLPNIRATFKTHLLDTTCLATHNLHDALDTATLRVSTVSNETNNNHMNVGTISVRSPGRATKISFPQEK